MRNTNRSAPRKTTYSDAEKAAYWKARAISAPQKSFAYGAKPTKAYSPQQGRYGGPTYGYRKRSYPAGSSNNLGASAGRALGAIAGTTLGGPAGGAVGSAIGSFLGGKISHLVDKITGFGEYKIAKNSIMSGGMTPPQVVNSVDNGGFIVRHREYIGDITATTAFTNRSYLINPGLSNTFPWLAQIAGSYEQYSLRGILFEFSSTSSDSLLSSATSTALGSVIMSTDYDVADDPPTNKRQMLNSEWSSSDKPSVTFIHPIECKKSVTPVSMLYTRSSIAVPAGFDQRLYDFARFNIATEGMQANGGVLGELWVTYEIELYKPQLSFSGQTDHYRLGGVTNAANLGTSVQSSIAAGGTIGGLISGSGQSYSFPPTLGNGKYLVTYYVVGGSATITVPTITFLNCVARQYWSNDIETIVFSPTTGNAAPRFTHQMLIEITSQGAAITYTGGVLPSAISSGDLWVTRVADSITTLPV